MESTLIICCSAKGALNSKGSIIVVLEDASVFVTYNKFIKIDVDGIFM
jgi:hypothetical protein